MTDEKDHWGSGVWMAGEDLGYWDLYSHEGTNGVCEIVRGIQREREGGMTEYVKGENRESPPSPPLLKSSNSPSLGWPYLVMLLRLQMKFRDIEWGEGWTDCSFPPLFAHSVKKEQRSDRR